MSKLPTFSPRKALYCDTETTGLSPWRGMRPFCIPMIDENENTLTFEWDVDPWTREVLPEPEELEYLREILARPKVTKKFYNAKFDLLHLESLPRVRVRGPVEDAYIKLSVLDTRRYSYELKPVSEQLLGMEKTDQQELQKAVVSARNIAKKLGWFIATEEEGFGKGYTSCDYWLPRAVWKHYPELAKPGWDTVCRTYAELDVVRTYRMDMFCDYMLKKDPTHYETYWEREYHLFRVLVEMEKLGVGFHRDTCERERIECLRKSIEERAELIRIAARMGHQDFNPGSDPQLRKVLFSPKPHGFGLPVERVTKKAELPSVDIEALKGHANIPFVHLILTQRSNEKAVGIFENYIRESVRDHVTGKGYCVHSTFNQMGAHKTARLSAMNPNVHNVENPDTAARSYQTVQARTCWGPREGYVWYKLDYAGQEGRIVADAANIGPIIKAAKDGRDINSEIANRAWGGDGNELAARNAVYSLDLFNPSLPQRIASLAAVEAHKPEEDQSDEYRQGVATLAAWKRFAWNTAKAKKYGLTSQQAWEVAEAWLAEYGFDIVKAEKTLGKKATRTRAKNLLYAYIYGAGVDKIAVMIGSSVADAREFKARFIEVVPGIDTFSKETIRKAKLDGYVINLYGRKLMVDRKKAYQAVNYLVQSTAADMMKDAMIRVHRYLEGTGLDAKIILSVHDELDIEVNRDHARRWMIRGVKIIMEDNGGRLKIPMLVEAEKTYTTWNECRPVRL